MDQATKHDSEKSARPELVAPEFILGTSEVLAFGAVKYDDGNWAKGMRWSRPYGALQRHMNAWYSGERYDPESGKSHLWHAACCLMFLIVYEARGLGDDDRARVGAFAPPTNNNKETTHDEESKWPDLQGRPDDLVRAVGEGDRPSPWAGRGAGTRAAREQVADGQDAAQVGRS